MSQRAAAEQLSVIVTGAAKGIGSAIARRCLNEGATVFGCDKNADALTQFRESLPPEHQARFFLQEADVTRFETLQTFFEGVDRQMGSTGRRALVNNAGIFLGKPLTEYTPEAIDAVLHTNLRGAIYCSQLFARQTLARGLTGVIVNIASIAGQSSSADAVYGATKAGLIGLTKSCALAFAPHIRVNAIAPGPVETDMMQVIPAARRAHYQEAALIKEPILPEDVAETAWFLLSEAGRHYTGAVFDLNNGAYLR